MTTPHEDELLAALPDDGDAGTVLSSFAVTARFRSGAGSAADAEREVRERLRRVAGLYDDVRVEPQEPDGRWALDVRFVLVSLDGETAVEGVHRSLREAGAAADEVWLSERLA